MKFFALIRTLVSYFLLGFVAIIFLIPAMFIAFLPKKYRQNNWLFFRLIDLFFKSILRLSFLPIKIKGKRNIPKNEPLIFVANHQSALDIPLVGSLCDGKPHLWLVLEYYLRKPILGFFIRRMYVPVDRDSPTKAARSLVKLLKMADGKKHIIIFPEGRRNVDEKIHEFFQGFAIIAKRTARRVIPVFIFNNAKIYPPNSFFINYYPIKATIGEPMQIKEDETAAEFCQRVRDWFLKQQ